MMRPGTLGLVACFLVGFLASPAQAEEGGLKTGGSYDALFGAGGRPTGPLQGSPVAPGAAHVKNGLKANLSGQPAGSAPFEQYLFIQGDVGEVNLGLGSGSAYSMQFTAPYSGVVTTGSPALDAVPRAGNPRAASYVLMAGQSYRLGYFTPRFAGMGGLGSQGAGAAPQPSSIPAGRLTEAYQTYEIGASYVARFDALELAFSADREGATSERGLTPDASAWSVGFGLSYAGFKLGGAYYHAEDLMLQSPALPRLRERGYTFGLGYGGTDWWIGTGVSRLSQQPTNGAGASATTTYRLGGEYRLSPGMMVFSDVLLYNTSAKGSGAAALSADDSRAIFLGVDLNF